jgi:hypothetical protein
MFSVVIRKSIWTHEESVVKDVENRKIFAPKVALLRKEVSLPFAPFLNLNIQQSSFNSGPIKSIAWLVEEQVFQCLVEDEFPRWSASYEELVTMSLDEGWERPITGGGNAPLTK